MDVNVFTDLITNRIISVETKKSLFHSFIVQNTEVFVPAFSMDTIFYILTNSHHLKTEIAKEGILNLLKYTRLLHTSDESVQYAFTSGFSDFEDGLIDSLAVYYCPEEYTRLPQKTGKISNLVVP